MNGKTSVSVCVFVKLLSLLQGTERLLNRSGSVVHHMVSPQPLYEALGILGARNSHMGPPRLQHLDTQVLSVLSSKRQVLFVIFMS